MARPRYENKGKACNVFLPFLNARAYLHVYCYTTNLNVLPLFPFRQHFSFSRFVVPLVARHLYEWNSIKLLRIKDEAYIYNLRFVSSPHSLRTYHHRKIVLVFLTTHKYTKLYNIFRTIDSQYDIILCIALLKKARRKQMLWSRYHNDGLLI